MSCKKVRYKSRSHAKAEMKKINRKMEYELTNPYYCEVCAGYHLTSESKTRYRKKMKKGLYKTNPKDIPQELQALRARAIAHSRA